jgi:hypothetical protein
MPEPPHLPAFTGCLPAIREVAEQGRHPDRALAMTEEAVGPLYNAFATARLEEVFAFIANCFSFDAVLVNGPRRNG